jgi:hypothetical protein
MSGIGCNYNDLSRIIISRCEIDLPAIKLEFNHLYSIHLSEMIEKEIIEKNKKALLLRLVEDEIEFNSC